MKISLWRWVAIHVLVCFSIYANVKSPAVRRAGHPARTTLTRDWWCQVMSEKDRQRQVGVRRFIRDPEEAKEIATPSFVGFADSDWPEALKIIEELLMKEVAEVGSPTPSNSRENSLRKKVTFFLGGYKRSNRELDTQVLVEELEKMANEK